MPSESDPQSGRPSRSIHIDQLLNPETETRPLAFPQHSHYNHAQASAPSLSPLDKISAMSMAGSHQLRVNHHSHDLMSMPPIAPKERGSVCGPVMLGGRYPSYEQPVHIPNLAIDRNHSSWQTSERASPRIVASASIVQHNSQNVERQDEQTLSKRKAPHAGVSEEPPKSKRKLAPRSSGTSKRTGHPVKRREANESNGDAPILEAPNVLYRLQSTSDGVSTYNATLVDIPAESNVTIELQTSRCMSSRYKREQSLPRCVACTRRWAGDTCRFQSLRSLTRNSNGDIVGFCFQEKPTPAMAMKFPDLWNTSLEKGHIQEIKRAIAVALLPTLREELEHVNHDKVICRPRELEVRATCDTCLTSIFSCSWMCRNCGREACAVCFDQVKNITMEPEGASQNELQKFRTRRENHANGNPFFLSCMKRNDHGAKDFSPVTRFSKVELEEVIKSMEELLREATTSTLSGNPQSEATSQADAQFHAPSSPLSSDSEATLMSSGGEIPSHEILRFTDKDLTEEIFRPLWAKGDPLLVTDVGPKLKVDWSPEYFLKNYGMDGCLIVECQSDDLSRRITVGEFFRDFGRYEGRSLCWKLKDWPPTSDFKKTFPQLYNDFSQAVPVPNYVRRDGVLNIASHFPSNTIGPDLGPKMYNANANLEQVNNKGSTRLHMDMADALNIMAYASPRPDGSDGCAAWDIFRAEDSDHIRRFIQAKFSLLSLDPIHSQQVYLDDDARRALWLEYGVKSYRIYQTVGQAVFIPAGCAHQVRNLSDCIKVAIDFVSPENIQRCEKLTREFRDLNQKKAWKEDVLQLRSMMWFAWLSCCRQEKQKSTVS